MTYITVERTISMGHRLPSYQGICSSMHGHNVRIEVTVTSARGEFLDFKMIDQNLKEITDSLDHAMVLFKEDPLLEMLQKIPEQRIVAINVEPTTEAIAELVFKEMEADEYEVTKVVVYETAKYSAVFSGPWRGVVRFYEKA